MADLVFDAIGTRWEITTPAPLGLDVRTAVAARIEAFDRTYSRFRSDSLVSTIARAAGSWLLPPDAPPLLDLYRRLYLVTDGAVTPLVGHALTDLGYDASYSLRPSGRASVVPAWDDVLEWDGARLTTSVPVLLDLGAAGKGYLVDLVAEVLARAGVADHVIDAGGDLRHHGDAPIRVALEHPRDPRLAVGVVALRDAALCASAPNRRAWAPGVHHLLDGRTGLPTHDILAAWALAPTAMVADGVATALYFAAPEPLAAEFGVSYVRLRHDGRAEWSADLPGEIFS